MPLIKPNSEAALQAQCIEYMRFQYPNIICFSIPNGGSRNKLEAIKLKKTGVLAGVPDLFIATHYMSDTYTFHGLFIELKKKGGRLTASQEAMILKLENSGYKVKVIYSFDEFVRTIKGLNLKGLFI